jgi:hypothetical protein
VPMTILLAAALASEAPPPPEPAAPPAKEAGMRIFLGGGSATSSGGTSEAAELGFHLTRMGQRVGGEYGVSLSAYQVGTTALPVFNFDGGLKWRPSPDWKVQPTLGAGVGVSFLIIVPFPSITASLGAVVPLGELNLDVTLRARQVLDLYTQSSGVAVGTLEFGVGF